MLGIVLTGRDVAMKKHSKSLLSGSLLSSGRDDFVSVLQNSIISPPQEAYLDKLRQ